METVTIATEEHVIFKKKLEYMIMLLIKLMLHNIYRMWKIVKDVSQRSHKAELNNSHYGKLKKRKEWFNQAHILTIKMTKLLNHKDSME